MIEFMPYLALMMASFGAGFAVAFLTRAKPSRIAIVIYHNGRQVFAANTEGMQAQLDANFKLNGAPAMKATFKPFQVRLADMNRRGSAVEEIPE